MADLLFRITLSLLCITAAQTLFFTAEKEFHRTCSKCHSQCSEFDCNSEACCNEFDFSALTRLSLVADCSHPDQSYIELPETAATESAAQLHSQLCGGFSLVAYYQYGCLTALPNNLCNFTDIRKITVIGEKLTEFPDLSCLHRLVILDLRDNQLTSVPENAFAGLELLEDVYLDYNFIQNIHIAVFDISLPYLRRVSVTHNRLTSAEPWPMTVHHQFCNFDFSYNQISHFTNTRNIKVDSSQTYGPGLFDLTHNNVTESPITFLKTYGMFDLLTLWAKFINWGFDLRENPFHCDCTFYDITLWLRKLNTVLWREYFNITCASPPRFRGVRIIDLPVDELTCSEPTNCPQNCTCEERPGKLDTLVNCTGSRLSELPFFMPEAKNLTLDLSNNSLVVVPPRKYLARTIHLDLRGNQIEMIDEDVPRRLRKSKVKILDLRNNPLRHLPYTFQALPSDAVFLDPDTLSCTCDLKWFPLWAQQSNSPRYQRFSCLAANGHKVLLRSATENDLGCNLEKKEPLAYKLSLISLAALLVVVGVVMVVFRYELQVLTHTLIGRIQRRRMLSSRSDVKERCVSSKRSAPPSVHYDVFLCMASESDADMTWIRDTLLPALHKNSLSVFWPALDCDPGSVELDQVTKKLQDSASALVILSEHFVNNPACSFQFGQAYDQMVRHGQGHLVLLLRGAISRKKITEPRLRAMVTLRMAHSVSQPSDLLKILGTLREDLHPDKPQTFDNIAVDKY